MSEDIHIDRLVLELPGLSLAEARALATELGEGLAAVQAGAVPPGSYDTVSASIDPRPGEPASRLASRILAQLFIGLR
jgi:hypothetical protein